LKIIHIVENLDKGAVENLLIDIFVESRKSRPDWQWTFFCILGREGRLDQKVRNAGGEIIYSPVTISNKIAFLRNLRTVLKTGKYDIIHAHHDYLSGFYLLASAGIKFRKRLLHIHNTDKSLPVGNRLLHQLLLAPFKKIAIYFSDIIIGVSREALNDFVNTANKSSSKYTVLYHGLDFSRFEDEPDPHINAELGIPLNSKIGLFVGRMNELKNPVFFVEILNEILKVRKDFYAVFVGTGDLEAAVREKANTYGIEDHIRMAGWCENVPMTMKSSDVFVFPRKEWPKEALGVVIVEAQAAGLPMFITKGVVDDAIVIKELAHYNDLNNPSVWARQIIEVLESKPAVLRSEATYRMKKSPFELSSATNNLIDIYER
jgi:glycosyltransferase EpsF